MNFQTYRRCSIIIVILIGIFVYLKSIRPLVQEKTFTAISRFKMEFSITTLWDGRPINHSPIDFALSSTNGSIELSLIAPFFNDPPNPGGPSGEPFPKLWDYEVFEVFFLAPRTRKYLEVEICPHGQHLVLQLEGYKKIVEDEFPLDYRSTVEGSSWNGCALIPLSYFPEGVSLFNAYAIHGSAESRVYESLFPVPEGKFSTPDFHRLDFFKPIDFKKLINK